MTGPIMSKHNLELIERTGRNTRLNIFKKPPKITKDLKKKLNSIVKRLNRIEVELGREDKPSKIKELEKSRQQLVKQIQLYKNQRTLRGY